MGVTNTNKQVSVDRIDCGGTLRVTLALAASPDIASNPTDSFWSWTAPEAWRAAL